MGGDEKLSHIRTILVTHLHTDHVLGIVPLMMTMMGPSAAAGGSQVRASFFPAQRKRSNADNVSGSLWCAHHLFRPLPFDGILKGPSIGDLRPIRSARADP